MFYTLDQAKPYFKKIASEIAEQYGMELSDGDVVGIVRDCYPGYENDEQYIVNEYIDYVEAL